MMKSDPVKIGAPKKGMTTQTAAGGQAASAPASKKEDKEEDKNQEN